MENIKIPKYQNVIYPTNPSNQHFGAINSKPKHNSPDNHMTHLLQGSSAAAAGVQALKRWMRLAGNCSTTSQLKALHAAFVVQGLHDDASAAGKLIASFCRRGDLAYASRLFDRVGSSSIAAWNALIGAYSRSSKPEFVVRYFRLMAMGEGGVRPDCYSLNFVILACGFARWFGLGRQLHGWVCKNGSFVSDSHVPTSVVRLYSRCGEMVDARKVFDEIPEPDLVQWNVVIDGYVKMGLESEALKVFRDMLVLRVEPDAFCVTTALKACALSGALRQGKWIHEYVKQKGMSEADVFVGTALVDMYAKCGCVALAEEVFEKMPRRNVFSWAAIIGGYAVHGHAREAHSCLERMQAVDGLKPDGVTILGVLMACTHAGLLEEGRALLDTMERRFGVVPRHEHYSCVVDLLCRAGRLEDALEMARTMPMRPLASVWGAFLNGCRIHKNIELAKLAFKELMQLAKGDKAEEEAALVQLSNAYLSVGRSEDASRIRRLIGEKGLNKMVVGCSMIEVNGIVNEFVSGDASHQHIAEIHTTLSLLFPGDGHLT